MSDSDRMMKVKQDVHAQPEPRLSKWCKMLAVSTPIHMIKESILRQVVNYKMKSYVKELKKTEQFVGVKPKMTVFGDFLEGYESTMLTEKWQNGGVPIKGNNYWTFGPPTQSGQSSRFDPESKLYQAWFGIYTHVGVDGLQVGFNGNEPDIEILKRLAEIDQEAWLKAYGDDLPLAKLERFEHKGHTTVSGQRAWIYYGEIASHSDVGFSGKGYEGAYGIARELKFTSPTKISKELFVPSPNLWQSAVDPYHRILLKGLFTVVPFENATVCIYLNGAEFVDNNQKHHDTWPGLETDALNMIQGVKLEAA